MFKIVLMSAAVVSLSACATTGTATAEERAYCERMEQDMALNVAHDHAAMKGLPANSMNLTHEKCQRILAQK